MKKTVFITKVPMEWVNQNINKEGFEKTDGILEIK